jgi:hypothetical protein
VNREIAETLKSAGFSGIKFQAAEIFSTTETLVGREVFELKVTGWGGIAPLESGIHVIKECPQCNRQVFSGFTSPNKLFSEEAWDGSDFFLIWPMPKYIMITDDVADHLIKSKYTGVRIETLDKLPKPLIDTYTPGHLHDWFDGGKLAEILKRLENK